MACDDEGEGERLSRPPTLEDLKRICAELNKRGVRYVVVGGMAVNFYGRPRGTEDIDLLINARPEAVARVKEALASALADGAAAEVADEDVERYTVVRVADEVVVDLMGHIGEVTVENARVCLVDVDGVNIPFAHIDTLLETKRGLREKDVEDRRFLSVLRENPHLLPPGLRKELGLDTRPQG